MARLAANAQITVTQKAIRVFNPQLLRWLDRANDCWMIPMRHDG